MSTGAPGPRGLSGPASPPPVTVKLTGYGVRRLPAAAFQETAAPGSVAGPAAQWPGAAHSARSPRRHAHGLVRAGPGVFGKLHDTTRVYIIRIAWVARPL